MKNPSFVRAVARGVVWSAALVTTLSSFSVFASQTRVQSVQGPRALLEGELEGASVGGDGVVFAGPLQRVHADGIAGAVLALTRGDDGALYVATGAPGRVVRIEAGKADVVFETDKPLVTALVALGVDQLVAITAPDGGAEVIEPKTKKHTSIPAPEAKMLLGAAALDGDVWAVGSNDDGGVLLVLPRGKTTWTVVARTKIALRSLAVKKAGRGVRVIAGSSEDGVVYEIVVEDGNARLRALLDAAPGEVTSVVVADDGTVFAGLIDGEGKLSKQAATKAKDDSAADEDDKRSAKKARARKVKGGEIWRLGTDGSARVVFQSKEHGPYTLAVDAREQRVLAGTGPQGRIVALDLDGRRRPGVLARRSGHDEITALLVERAAVVVGASHGGAVLSLETGVQADAAYLSPPLEAEGRARWGLLRVTLDRPAEKGPVRVALRTGTTREPDETWSAWSSWAPLGADGVVLVAPPAPFAQAKVELPAGARVSALHLAYLVDNRAPEVVSVEVLAPGWKVVSNPREAPETRSVTLGEKPFVRFLDRRGGQNPTLEERPYGKQSFDVGYRTVFAYVEDEDKDALRYRYWIGKASTTTSPATAGDVASWKLLQDWSEAPFVSFEASRLSDGDYRVKVEVDDSPTNGPTRALSDAVVSDRFAVHHGAPRVFEPKASRSAGGVRVAFRVEAALPLVSVRCSTELSEWLPLDPSDGILDGRVESFDVALAAAAAPSSVSCEAYDEALNFERFDLVVR